MQEQKGAAGTELEEAWGKAWSCSEKPPGQYVGSIMKGDKTYFFYKQDQEYFYETNYDRKIKKEQRERRINSECRLAKSKNKTERCG